MGEHLRQALAELFKISEADESEEVLARRTVFATAYRAANALAQSMRFVDAVSLLDEVLDRAVAVAEGVRDPGVFGDGGLIDLDRCVWQRFLCVLARDRGDVVGASVDLDILLRQSPALVGGRGIGFMLDIARASKEGDVEAFTDV